MRANRTPPKHAGRPGRWAGRRIRETRLLLVVAVSSLLGLAAFTIWPLGATGDDGPPARGQLEATRYERGGHARRTSIIASGASGRSATSTPVPTSTTRSTAPAPARPAGASRSGALAVGVQFHGMWDDYTNSQRLVALDKLAAAHLRWVRVDMAWSGFEDRCRGCVNRWYLDLANFVVDSARARGFKVLVTLWGTPGWANRGAGQLAPPVDAAEYGRFSGWLAARFKGRVAAYEIWNEPDSDSFFSGTLPQYVGLLRAAYPAIKTADPDALVVLGGPTANNTPWLGSVYAAGGRNSFDVLATHPYMAPGDLPPETPDRRGDNIYLLSHVAAVRKLMVANGDAGKPIWFTEMGWSSHPNSGAEPNWMRGVSLAQQADYSARAIRFIRANYPYVTNMFFYNDRNRSSGNLQVDNYGLLNRDLTEKPVYASVRSALAG
jgi:hypothetical protein